MRGEGVQARSPLCRTEPSARGVAPATAVVARPATGGRAARPQDVATPADKQEARCESPNRKIVKRPPASFSHSSAAQFRAVGCPTRTCGPRPAPPPYSARCLVWMPSLPPRRNGGRRASDESGQAGVASSGRLIGRTIHGQHYGSVAIRFQGGVQPLRCVRKACVG